MNPDMNFSECDRRILEAHTYTMQTHSNVLACHCECLGMNAENMLAACAGKVPPYAYEAYMAVMKKWGLIDGESKPII
uniref:Uncharacterized protein n=1 Tax=viral metagenome TaxID=1070528 RepID=A0A6M3LN27_9ZZZZ